MQVTVISPERSVFEGDAESIVAPAFDGQVGILPRHAPFMTLLGKGELRITRGGVAQRYEVQGGFLQVAADRVRVVAEHAKEKK